MLHDSYVVEWEIIILILFLADVNWMIDTQSLIIISYGILVKRRNIKKYFFIL